jgi:predicted Rossmann fold nucleotide-binding protein DprA/Smf involved in DNA uptake
MAEIVIISPEDEIYPKDRLATWFPNLPALHTLGNLDLLRLPLAALFCSRKCPGDAILKAYDLAQELREKQTPVIGGFHTPVEKDMLEIMLKGKGPIVICPARGLEGMRMPKVWREGVDQGRIIFLSIAPPQEKHITLELAHQRNLLVAAFASMHMLINVDIGGETEKVAELISMKKAS